MKKTISFFDMKSNTHDPEKDLVLATIERLLADPLVTNNLWRTEFLAGLHHWVKMCKPLTERQLDKLIEIDEQSKLLNEIKDRRENEL